MYDSFLGISGALYLDLFEHPVEKEFSRSLLINALNIAKNLKIFGYELYR
jgi:hypothetical protein